MREFSCACIAYCVHVMRTVVTVHAICEGLPEACNFIKKETLAQVFSYEFCEISKSTFSYVPTPKVPKTGGL